VSSHVIDCLNDVDIHVWGRVGKEKGFIDKTSRSHHWHVKLSASWKPYTQVSADHGIHISNIRLVRNRYTLI